MRVLFSLSLLATPRLLFSAASSFPVGIAQVEERIKNSTYPSVERLVEQSNVGSGFTLAFDSRSAQGKERGLLFGPDARTVIGIQAEGGLVEVADDVDGAITPYRILVGAVSDPKGYHVTKNPGNCRECHGAPFTYIWPEYDNSAIAVTWRGFLGEVDDRIDPDSRVFKELKQAKNFAPLFKDSSHRPSFPYWQLHLVTKVEKVLENKNGIAKDGGVLHADQLPSPPEGKLYSFRERRQQMNPNETLDVFLPVRAARSVSRRASAVNPRRYNTYKVTLLRYALCSVNGGRDVNGGDENWNKEMAQLRKDFKKEMPERFAKWRSVEERVGENAKRKLYGMMLLDYLGVPPESIMLTKPVMEFRKEDTESVLDDADHFLSFLRSYQGESPLEFNADGESLVYSISRFLPGLEELKHGSNLAANYYFPKLDFLAKLGHLPKTCEQLAKISLSRLSATVAPETTSPAPVPNSTHK